MWDYQLWVHGVWCVGERGVCMVCGAWPLNAAPASTDDTCVAPANVSRGPSSRSTGPGPLHAAPALCRACPVSRLPTFRAARARARHRSRAPKCRACQHKRHLCRACQRCGVKEAPFLARFPKNRGLWRGCPLRWVLLQKKEKKRTP